MKIGYMRVSTTDQSVNLQKDALADAGCDKFYTDTASGARADRPGLDDALQYARPGDCLVVWRLDRLGRNLPHLIAVVESLHAREIGFKSLSEGIDTTTPSGKLIFHIFGALAEFERDLIVERTKAGLAAARARGRKGGRRNKLNNNDISMLIRMYSSKEYTVEEICKTFHITRPTMYKYLKDNTKETA